MTYQRERRSRNKKKVRETIQDGDIRREYIEQEKGVQSGRECVRRSKKKV